MPRLFRTALVVAMPSLLACASNAPLRIAALGERTVMLDVGPSLAGAQDHVTPPAREPAPADRGTYEKNVLFVVISPDSGAYAITDAEGIPISENEFVRRYRSVTGSDALSPYNRPRRTGWIAAGCAIILGGLAIGAPLAAYGAKTDSLGDSRNGDLAVGGVILATLGAFVGGAVLFEGLTDRGGDPWHDHFLSESVARLYVAEYNRALGERTLRPGSDRP